MTEDLYRVLKIALEAIEDAECEIQQPEAAELISQGVDDKLAAARALLEQEIERHEQEQEET